MKSSRSFHSLEAPKGPVSFTFRQTQLGIVTTKSPRWAFNITPFGFMRSIGQYYMGKHHRSNCEISISIANVEVRLSNITIENGYELCRVSLQYGYVLQLKESFKMGLFSDTKHTHPAVFILESPPPGAYMAPVKLLYPNKVPAYHKISQSLFEPMRQYLPGSWMYI